MSAVAGIKQTIHETMVSVGTSVASIGASVVDSVVAVRDSLVQLLRRIANGFRAIGPVAIGLAGCQAAVDAKVSNEAPAITLEVEEPTEVDDTPKPLGDFNITFYYVVGEEEIAAKVRAKAIKIANDNEDSGSGEGKNTNEDEVLAAVNTEPPVTIYTGNCEPLVEVSKEFAAALSLQGTGLLRDGRVVNVWGHCSCDYSPCFKVTESKWGTAGNGRPLQPFRTVAVDPKLVKLGSLLHVPILEGRTMPGRSPWGGFVHDGCVVADDTGGGIDGNQLDLFVGRRGYYLGVSGKGGSHAWAKHVPVFDGTKLCERKGRKVGRKTGAI
ncbi:MAG: 3D domain-containing protein [Kofleriaceae bacterium]